MDLSHIRNFCIIAHIDHGKSTLADRFIEICGNMKKEDIGKQLLDSMELEKERGITIKLKAIRMPYTKGGKKYELNLIDTPGHVDFGYEVSRSLAACEGALLLVDASQGVQAQTIANLEKAKAENLKIIPVVNKIDLPHAEPEKTALELIELGFDEKEIAYTSGKSGEGVEDLLDKILRLIPAPKVGILEGAKVADYDYHTLKSENTNTNNLNNANTSDNPNNVNNSNFIDNSLARGLIFDSFYDDYRGVIAFVRIVSGSFAMEDTLLARPPLFVKFLATKTSARVVELGYLSPLDQKVSELNAGEVGYIATGLKNIQEVQVGDTVTIEGQDPEPISGYTKPVPVVFLSFYPDDASNYQDLRVAMDRLKLSDSSFSFEPENIGSIGKGFRCGFLGLLHAEIIRERIEREFDINIITTSPSVLYKLTRTDGLEIEIKSATEYPDATYVKEVKEPYAHLDVYTTENYMSKIMDLCKERRAIYIETKFLEGHRVKITYEIPLIELIIDFYDKLKSISSGYASIDYSLLDYRPVDVVRMDIYVANDEVAPLAQLVLRKSAHDDGKRIVAKLKDLIPRQQFKVSLQAAIGGKFVAREDISPVRKDVTGYLYGGDVTRKKKLLEKQKKGKKRLKRFGSVDIPQDVFWKVMER